MDQKYLDKLDGYSLRNPVTVQATLTKGDSMRCQVCEREVFALTGMEKDHPDSPDLWICSQCLDEYFRHKRWYPFDQETA